MAASAKKAFITGISGQDGSYLAELLLDKGYEVYGLIRRESLEDATHRLRRIDHLRDQITLVPGSIDNYPSIFSAIRQVVPDEVYHLAAYSYVSFNFDDELSTLNTNVNGTHYVLSCCRELVPDSRIYFAGSSEMFGKAESSPQNEKTPFRPRSVYGISKVASFDMNRAYREHYDMFTCGGILFNHESPRRGFQFVTRKITHHAARIKLGLQDTITLGNIDATRDWGHSREYVDAMWRMLQQDQPDDYVIATGVSHSVRDLLDVAFGSLGLDFNKYLRIDERFVRPTEPVPLVGNPQKARDVLGWQAQVTFEELIEEMVQNDLDLLQK